MTMGDEYIAIGLVYNSLNSHRSTVNSPHKGSVARKMFPFDWSHHVHSTIPKSISYIPLKPISGYHSNFSSSMRTRYGVTFVSSMSDWCSAAAIAVLIYSTALYRHSTVLYKWPHNQTLLSFVFRDMFGWFMWIICPYFSTSIGKFSQYIN